MPSETLAPEKKFLNLALALLHTLSPMLLVHCMGRKKVVSQTPVVEKPVLEEEVDEQLNPEFAAMKAIAKNFSPLTTQEKHLIEL